VGADGTAVFTVTVSGAELTAAAAVPFAVDLCASDPANNPGDDCDVAASGVAAPARTGGTLMVSPNAGSITATGTITLTALTDMLSEPDETITVSLADNPSTSGDLQRTDTAAQQSATAVLTDNNEITVTVDRKADESGAVVEGAMGSVTFKLAGGIPVAPVTIRFRAEAERGAEPADFTIAAYADDGNGNKLELSEAPDGSDYRQGVLTVAAGQTSADLELTAVDDDFLEPEERVRIRAHAASSTTAGGAVKLGGTSYDGMGARYRNHYHYAGHAQHAEWRDCAEEGQQRRSH